MSVANLETGNLASFAAAAVRLGLAQLADVAELLAAVADANAAALSAQYGDTVDPITKTEIASAALEIIAERADDLGWPPLVYNCVTNDGRLYLADDVAETVRGLERMVDSQRDADERRTADRYLIDLDAAGAPVGPARPAPARFVPMFAD